MCRTEMKNTLTTTTTKTSKKYVSLTVPHQLSGLHVSADRPAHCACPIRLP